MKHPEVIRIALAVSRTINILLLAFVGPALAQRPVGTLDIYVPAKFLSNPWWLYVDGEIAGSSEGVTTGTYEGDFRHDDVSGDGNYYIVDEKKNEMIIRAEWKSGIVTTIDPKIMKTIFTPASVSLRQGKHTIEFVAKSGRGRPFAISKTEVVVTPANRKVVAFGLPPLFVDSDQMFLDQTRGPMLETLNSFISNIVNELGNKVSAFSQDAAVIAIRDGLGAPSFCSSTPSIFLELPVRYGGPRCYVSAQVNYIVDFLQERYGFRLDSDISKSEMSPSLSEAFEQLSSAVAKHNLQIQRLREVGNVLVSPRRSPR